MISGKMNEINKLLIDRTERFYDIRTFQLINESLETFEITGKFETSTDPFLQNVGGLGHKKNITSFKLGTREVIASEELEIDNLKGELLFYGDFNADKYTMLSNFKSFVALSKNLKINYQVPFKQEESIVETDINLTCDTILEIIDYGEVDSQTGALKANVEFRRLTPWKSDIKQSDVIYSSENPGTRAYKIGDKTYRYDDAKNTQPRYGVGTKSECDLQIFGTSEVYLKVTIFGPTERPELTIRDSNLEVVKSFAIEGSFTKGDKIVIDSEPTNYSVTKNGINIYPQVVKSSGYDSFLALNPGEYNFQYKNGLIGDAGNLKIEYSLEYL